MEQQTIDTKSLFAPKKGKQATKGQKQIVEENKGTIQFYSAMALGTLLFRLLFFLSSASTMSITLTVFALIVQCIAIGGMRYTARPILSGSSNAIIDGGIDLDLKGGFGDYLKDLVITTSACTVLSAFSNAFWVLWLWFPAYLVYKIWMNVIAPWIFQPAPEEVAPEIADKKRRKMERKMARAGYNR